MYLSLQLLHQLSLSLLAILVSLQLPLVVGVFLVQLLPQLNVLLDQRLLANFIAAYLAAGKLQRLLQLQNITP